MMYRPELCDAVRARTARHADRARGHHRHRELGAHARTLRPVLRGSVRRSGFAPSTACCRRRRALTPRMSGHRSKQPAQRPSQTRVDGRRLRSERTKQLIIEAYLALAQENSPQVPTAAEIAHRAGYSVRSVFERFPDIHTLQVAAADYAWSRSPRSRRRATADGDRQTRIETQVETRGQSCERWLPLWRSLGRQSGRSPRSSGSGSSCRANVSWRGWSSCTRRNCRRCRRSSAATC